VEQQRARKSKLGVRAGGDQEGVSVFLNEATIAKKRFDPGPLVLGGNLRLIYWIASRFSCAGWVVAIAARCGVDDGRLRSAT